LVIVTPLAINTIAGAFFTQTHHQKHLLAHLMQKGASLLSCIQIIFVSMCFVPAEKSVQMRAGWNNSLLLQLEGRKPAAIAPLCMPVI
jgi:hypothetical protein